MDRIAVGCLNRVLSRDRDHDEDLIRTAARDLGFTFAEDWVVLDPLCTARLSRVLWAVRRAEAVAVIVPSLDHLDGIVIGVLATCRVITAADQLEHPKSVAPLLLHNRNAYEAYGLTPALPTTAEGAL